MTEYRAYLLDQDGRIHGSRAFVCENDGDAVVWAEHLVDDHDIELWSGDRFVKRLSSTGKPDAVSHEVKDGRMVPKK